MEGIWHGYTSPDPAAPVRSTTGPITAWFSDANFLPTGPAGLAGGIPGDRLWIASNFEASFETIALAHELGHVLGLEHELDEEDFDNLMSPGFVLGTELSTLTLYDTQVATVLANELIIPCRMLWFLRRRH